MAFAAIVALLLLLGWVGVKPSRRSLAALFLIGCTATFIQLRG